MVTSSLFFSDGKEHVYAQIQSLVVISEIAAHEPDDHEWVEIYNTGDLPIDMQGFIFWEGGVNHQVSLARGVGSALDSHAFAIIAENANQFMLDYPQVDALIFDSSWGSLNESGEVIGLKNERGEIMELFTYISVTEHSLERVDAYFGDYTAQNWKEHETSNTAGRAYGLSRDEDETIDIDVETEMVEIVATDESGGKDELYVENMEVIEEHTDTSTSSMNDVESGVEIVQQKASIDTKNDPETIVFFEEAIVSSTFGTVLVADSSSTAFISTTVLFSATATSTGATEQIAGDSSTVFPTSTSNSSGTGQTRNLGLYELGNIVINEFVSNPADGAVEFVELKNITQRMIDIEDWYFQEGSGAKTYFKGRLEAGKLYTIEKPKGSLNNAGDSLYIFDSTGKIIYEIEYGTDAMPASAKGESVARGTDGIYAITTEITKGGENKFSPRLNVEHKNVSDNTSKYVPQNKSESKSIEKNSETKDAKTKESAKKVTPEFAGHDTIDSKIKSIDPNIFNLRVSEFMPNPAGADDAEFIELFNPTSAIVALYGLILDDAEGGSKPYMVEDHSILKSGAYMVFSAEKTGIALNNSSDAVRLSADGVVIDQVSYDNAREDQSYAFAGGAWQWTEFITPGTKNMWEERVGVATVAEDGLENPKEIKAREKSFESLSISVLSLAEMGDAVEVRGVVTVLPGVLGSQYFYIHDTSEHGAEIYMYKKDFPKLSMNDEVVVRGVVAQSNKRKRIKVSAKADIRVIGKEESVTPIAISAGDMGEADRGSLVQISGEITDKKKNSLYVDDGSGEIMVSLKKGAGIQTDAFEEGSFVTISGIVFPTKDGFSLVPRLNEDISLVETEQTNTVTEVVPEVLDIETTKRDMTVNKNAFISFGALLLCAIAYAGYKLKMFFPAHHR